jgi:hypothetical protein
MKSHKRRQELRFPPKRISKSTKRLGKGCREPRCKSIASSLAGRASRLMASNSLAEIAESQGVRVLLQVWMVVLLVRSILSSSDLIMTENERPVTGHEDSEEL